MDSEKIVELVRCNLNNILNNYADIVYKEIREEYLSKKLIEGKEKINDNNHNIQN